MGPSLRIDQHPCRWLAACALTVALVLATTPVPAQRPVGSTDETTPGGPGQRQRGPVAAPGSRFARAPWPRLDAGAFLCRTPEDLAQHHVAVAARLDGGHAAEPPGCRMIQGQTAVSVLAREGPGRTQVRITATPTETGWTNSFLPDKSPGP